MAYIGKQPTVGNFVKLDAITTSATTTFNLTNGGVAYSPQSANHCIVSLNGVIQSPGTSFTISGSTIVFASALTSSDVIDFILVLGDVLNIGTPSDATVGFSKITSNLITGATAETSIDGADSVLIYDDSATALRKMTRTNFVAGIGATAGQVIQVVSATTNTEVERSTSTSTYFKTALTANITCSATSSKVLILITACGSQRTQYAYLKGNITKTVGGSDSELYSTGQAMVGTDIGSDLSGTLSIAYLDSPSTTSQLTYTLSTKASNTYRIFRDDIQASIILLEIKG